MMAAFSEEVRGEGIQRMNQRRGIYKGIGVPLPPLELNAGRRV